MYILGINLQRKIDLQVFHVVISRPTYNTEQLQYKACKRKGIFQYVTQLEKVNKNQLSGPILFIRNNSGNKKLKLSKSVHLLGAQYSVFNIQT